MQFNVPQFIDIEDKIMGPLTLKQFLLVLGVGVFFIFLWYIFKLWVVIIVGVPVAAFLAAIIFVKVNGRSFFSYFKSWLNFITNPKVYIWKRKSK